MLGTSIAGKASRVYFLESVTSTLIHFDRPGVCPTIFHSSASASEYAAASESSEPLARQVSSTTPSVAGRPFSAIRIPTAAVSHDRSMDLSVLLSVGPLITPRSISDCQGSAPPPSFINTDWRSDFAGSNPLRSGHSFAPGA